MNHDESFDVLLEAHFAGEDVEIPDHLRQEFDRAVAADAALRNVLDDTAPAQQASAARRGPPRLSDDYQLQKEIGRGGMGVVYLAHQRSLNRQVAVKVLRPGERAFGSLVDRFLDEAHHLAGLRHPNIVAIHEVGDADGEPYFTMQYVEGESLADVTARGPLTPSRAVEIIKQVAAAVQYAHRQGIIHRDLKPANVLIDAQGRVFVGDFGLARNLARDSSLTQSGELLGTPQYMSPEQARGQTALIGEATDIHALGLVLYEMLTGHPPFPSDSPADALVALLNREPPSPRRANRRIPRDLETITLKCLQKSPADRYANVGALLEDIRRYETGLPLQARRAGPVLLLGRWCVRRWKAAALAAAILAIVFAAGPHLFDRSFDDLVAWGDEELAAGDAVGAARIYGRAFRKGTETERAGLAQRIAGACRVLDDASLATSLALPLLDHAPDLSFGKHDYAIAQALIMQHRGESVGREIDLWHGLPSPQLERIGKRLDMAFATGIPENLKSEAEQTLTAIKLALAADKPYVRYLPDYLYELPGGDEEQLEAILADADRPHWDRGRAGISLARLQHRRGDLAAARVAYRRAYELIRQVYPLYGGAKAPSGRPAGSGAVPDAEECRLVRTLVTELRQLDPEGMPEPRGGLEFVTAGYRLPAGIEIDLEIELTDPAIENPDAGLSHNLPRRVPLRSDAPAVVQVLDGTYRLRRSSHSMRWTADAESIARRLEVDTSAWPDEVEIHGKTLRLPPVEIRQLEAIELLQPADGSVVKLNEVELRWQPVAAAVRYGVQLSYTTFDTAASAAGPAAPVSTTVYFTTLSSDGTALRLADLTGRERDEVAQNWTASRTANWRVDAYDENDRRLGVTVVESSFLVAAPLIGESRVE